MEPLDRDKVIADIRACLVASGVGLSIFTLQSDYRNFIGREIPFRQLGSNSLLEFLQSVDQFRISYRGSEIHVEAVASAESSHIAALVRGQKKSKPKSRPNRNRNRNFNHAKAHVSRPFASTSSSFPKSFGNNSPPYSRPFPNKSPSYPQKGPQSSSSHGSKPPSLLPKHTFAGNKLPESGNNPVKPNLNFVKGEPLTYSQPSTSNHTFPGSKPNVTSTHQQQAPKPFSFQSKPAESPAQFPKQNDTVEVKSSVLTSRAVQPNTVQCEKKESTQKAAMSIQRNSQPILNSNINQSSRPPNGMPQKPLIGSSDSSKSFQNTYSMNKNAANSTMPTQNINSRFPSVNQNFIPCFPSPNQNLYSGSPFVNQNFNSSSPSFNQNFNPSSPFVYQNFNSGFPSVNQNLTQNNGTSFPPFNPKSAQFQTPFVQNIPLPSQTRNFKVAEHPCQPQNFVSQTSAISTVRNQVHNQVASLPPKPPVISSNQVHNQVASLPPKPPVFSNLSRISPFKHRSGSVSPMQSRLERVRQPQENHKLPVLESFERKQSDSNAIKTKFLPQLKKPPVDSHWELFLLNFVDLSKVSVRLIGAEYSDKFALLEDQMTERYIENSKTAHKVLPSELVVGSSYVFVNLKNKFVARVLLQRYFKQENEVSVVFFDLAEEAVVPADMIYELDDNFTSLAPQSFEVFLEGLEVYKFREFHEEDFGADSFCEKGYVAIISNQEDPCAITVHLYDTSPHIALDVNQTLRNKVAGKIASLHEEKKMLKDNECVEALITNIDEMGNIFINILDKTYNCLLERLTDIDTNKNLKIQTVTSLEEIVPSRYYFVSGESPLRAVLDTIISENSVLMEFVDCGQFRIVHVEQLFSVPQFDKVFEDIPHQATMVRLAGVDYSWAQRHQSLFIEIVEIFSKAVVEVQYIRNDFPFVKITINKNGKLINVGDAMNSMDLERNKTVAKKMYEVNGQFIYKQSTLPTNTYIAVLVPACENAENLTLVDLIQELRDLTEELRSYYSVNKITQSFEEWRVGDPCVIADHDGENYFRGVILQLDSSKFARIRCVDFGYTMIVPIDCVYILDDNFKETPALAINAKLHGIEPIYGGKNFEATKLLNYYLKEQRKFCARVVDVDNSNPSSSTYSILLFDTSTDVDINFSELLVDSGLAIRAPVG